MRSPPLRGGDKLGWPRGGRPGDGAEGGFLGGARSPRPDCKAELAPWQSISTRWGREAGGLPGICLAQTRAILRASGARPSQGWTTQEERPCEKGPEIARGEVFSEDALCASASYGRTNGKASGCHRCFYDKPVAERRDQLGSRHADITGVQSPPLPGVDHPRGETLRGRPGYSARGGFLGGCALRVRIARPSTYRGVSLHEMGTRVAVGL